MRAVVDRMEGDTAVLLLGEEEIQLDLPLKYLPDGVEESTILYLRFEIDHEETSRTLETMQKRIDRLKRKSR